MKFCLVFYAVYFEYSMALFNSFIQQLHSTASLNSHAWTQMTSLEFMLAQNKPIWGWILALMSPSSFFKIHHLLAAIFPFIPAYLRDLQWGHLSSLCTLSRVREKIRTTNKYSTESGKRIGYSHRFSFSWFAWTARRQRDSDKQDIKNWWVYSVQEEQLWTWQRNREAVRIHLWKYCINECKWAQSSKQSMQWLSSLKNDQIGRKIRFEIDPE